MPPASAPTKRNSAEYRRRLLALQEASVQLDAQWDEAADAYEAAEWEADEDQASSG